LSGQLNRPQVPFVPGPTRSSISDPDETVAVPRPSTSPPTEELEAFNGYGGFAADGREYVVRVGGGVSPPPVPWSNVVAQARFGFACTESGPGYTWSGNSHENRLTPWNNDPVGDPPGEALFLRNEATGAFWSTTPLPAGGGEAYVARHGHGYTAYEHTRDDIRSVLTIFVPRQDPLKVFRLSLHNASGAIRRLSITLYAEWVLGENRSRTSIHVLTGVEPATGALVAHNRFRQTFRDCVAFLDLSPGDARTVTGDRTEFIGRNGRLRRPAAMGRDEFSNRVGAAYDPCGAIRVAVDLDPGETRVFVGLLGEAESLDDVRALVERYRDPAAVETSLQEVRGFWADLLGTIVVRTPDRAMDLMLNGWLLYQTLACRIWGRSAFYQSSGAFGFRDQLQDTLALNAAAPDIPRAHLLHAASRQFIEGDVQHWWHEPGGQGVRTRFADDRLWLPYAALHYVAATGDDRVYDEVVPFLSGRLLNEGEHEAYETPADSGQSGTLYEHCLRAIDVSLRTGAHGLPLMGTGDWNDGMSLVGAAGRGESVWMGWFLVAILRPFADLVESRGDADRATRYREHAATLVPAIEQAWDGEWYRRAYFDDGTPLGSKENREGRIDAIAQSWSVISGAGDPGRTRLAMDAVERLLVRRDDGVVLLLTPPFDVMEPNPGYIRGYLPGVRENGGQYTHAAIWNVLAFALLGDGERAASLFALLNPVNHGRSPQEVARYRAEPYVIAADVYSVSPHTGRAGWTWYTGSAGWMYRVGVEAILGIGMRNGALHVDPCIPPSWPGFEAVFTHDGTSCRIVVTNRRSQPRRYTARPGRRGDQRPGRPDWRGPQAPPSRGGSGLERLQVFDEIGLLRSAQAKREQRIVVIDDSHQILCAAVVEVRRMLPQCAQRRRSVHPRGRSLRVTRIHAHFRWCVQEGSVRPRSLQDVGERRPAVAGRTLAGAAEDLFPTLSGLGIKTTRRGIWRLQAFLIIEQRAESGRHEIRRLRDGQPDAWIAEASVATHLSDADITVPVRNRTIGRHGLEADVLQAVDGWNLDWQRGGIERDQLPAVKCVMTGVVASRSPRAELRPGRVVQYRRERHDGADVQIRVGPAVETMADALGERIVNARMAQRAGDADTGQLTGVAHRSAHADDGIQPKQFDGHGRTCQVHLLCLDRVDDGRRQRVDVHLQSNRESRGRRNLGDRFVHPQDTGPQLLVAERVVAEDLSSVGGPRGDAAHGPA
jgi:cellobiose phosphorylase